MFELFFSARVGEATIKIADKSTSELINLWNTYFDYTADNWNTGRERKLMYYEIEVFLMNLTVLKHSGAWGIIANILDSKGPANRRHSFQYQAIL